MDSGEEGVKVSQSSQQSMRSSVRDGYLVSDHERAFFAAQGCRVRLAAGEQLFAEGDTGRTMYVVESGQVELVFGDDMFCKQLGVNGFFGELGLLIGDHLRSASAHAVTDCVLLEIDHTGFEDMLKRDPACVAGFLHRAIMRVVDNEQSLMHSLRRRNRDLQTALDSLREATDRLTRTQELTRTDDLTGLSNRRGFVAMIEQRRKLGALDNCGLLIIDCDAFKGVNDRHGHIAGDRVLQSVAHVLRTVSGSVEVTARLGGDEFCVLACLEDTGDLERMADYLVGTARALWEMHGEPPLICRLSIGGCLIEAERDWQSWYATADAALYRVKARGGDGFEIATSDKSVPSHSPQAEATT
ncbi:MAG: GGDEF domain-containing protein [Xanthomonadaceae bacterium]|nr:GGDEF domain-containing protein [Xanthomonadaceae bacterium]